MHRILVVARRSPDIIAAMALSWLLFAGLAHGGAPEVSLVPKSRPATLTQTLLNLFIARPGSVCGVAAIKGDRLKPLKQGDRGCGIAMPVRVTSVSGIELSTGAVIDCPTAKALNSWVAKTAKPAFRDNRGGLVGLHVAASYVCRTRNSQEDAKMSEHSLGHAIDISAFEMQDGGVVTVLEGWTGAGSKALKRLHKGACGTFGTVLGPEFDSYHLNHFHFDTARYRSGSYCH